ncbi:MAG: CRTAC1 family protein [Flavobacteriales bacterium]|jgi:hypothetical protein|nr:CRTAC1 family protein [Flavobacteriales bacterium]
MTFKIKRLSIVAIITLVLSSCTSSKRDVNTEELIGGLELLSSEQTGIHFNNSIKESETVNHIYYNQIYSGAGVAIGDINNDGFPDIFFAGNQEADRLYINKGELKFEDISKSSKISRSPGWSWGVTMADVNADGYLDIYVCRNGESMNPTDRKNKLFINNKDLTFTESASEYGIADKGFSSQSVFFDMDNDGDLDMYLVNQIPDSRLFKRYSNIPKERYKLYKDKLFKNENGKFIEVSKDAGLIDRYTYGLSVNASDLNNDGWVDLFVSNDYDEPDFMYYNNGDGTFTNVIIDKLKHISRFSMGSDTGDINNDGFIDLLTLDMAAEDHYRSKTNMKSMNSQEFKEMIDKGDHHQYMFNTLQINNGLGEFSDIASLAGVAKTDWSWGGVLVDLNNDGFKDILISNGVKKDVRNNDFLTELNEKLKTDSKDFYSMAKMTPSNPLPNYVFKNKNGLEFENVSKQWGFDLPSFSHGISYADLDNDGDLDIVTNNMETEASIYKNNTTGNYLKVEFKGSAKNTFGYGSKVFIYTKNKTQVSENTVTRGYLSSKEPILFFGLGKEKNIDSVKVIWPNGNTKAYFNLNANSTLTAVYSNAMDITKKVKEVKEVKTIFSKLGKDYLGINFTHKENEFDDFKEEILLPHKLSTNGPFSATADVNGDGLDDVFIGGAAQQEGTLFLQTKEGKFQKSSSSPWYEDKDSEDLEVLFFDLDGDGDNDLYVASGGSEFKSGNKLLKDRVYINDGVGNFSKSLKIVPEIYESSQTVEASDIDGDGDLDLFVGTRLIAGKYTYPATSYILINENGIFKKAPKKTAISLQNIGMVTDAVFSDIDNDGDEDLLVVGEWMEIKVLENKSGIFTDNSQKFGIKDDSRGIWWSITKNDLDNDGDDDYILGNLGNNNKFKATKEHPFKVYANDFDGNGTNDVVLAKYYKDGYVPMRGKECTTQQMPYVGEKFKDFHSFASSKLIDILPEKTVEEAVVYEISNFESILLINENGKLTAQKLPIQAQISPIKNSLVDDFNNDGFKDILLVGNHYGVEVETVRYDAGYGSLFIGDGKNKFKFLPPTSSGFYIPTDSRAISSIKTINNSKIYLVTNNNDSIALFKNNMELMSN